MTKKIINFMAIIKFLSQATAKYKNVGNSSGKLKREIYCTFYIDILNYFVFYNRLLDS